MSKIKCVILKPTETIETQEVDMVILPGSKGQLGVLYNHAPLIVELSSGKIQLYKENILESEIDITNSIAYIRGDIIEIFAV